MNWHWIPEEAPPSPRAAVALGAARQPLWEQLRQQSDAELAGLSLTANRDVLIVLAAAERLPWTAGIAYAAPRPDVAALWLPTTQRPSLPLDIVERAVRGRFQRHPALLWPEPAWVLPLDRQLPASIALLDRIAEYWR